MLFAIFILGLFVGSFLNCVIYRLKIGKGFLKGRSFCPYCKQVLSWQDLVPVFSFLILRGKCRYCQKRISWQYPLVEITTGILFVLILNYQLRIMNYEIFDFGNIINLLFLILSSSFLILIFVYDLKHYIILDKIIYPAIGIAFLYQLFGKQPFGEFLENLEAIINPLAAALGGALFFLLIVLVSRGRWMGVGDVKLAFFMGLFLGFPNILVALFLSFFIGAIIGIGLILAKKKGLKSEIPFGPFLVTGTFLALFWGEMLIDWYLNIFL